MSVYQIEEFYISVTNDNVERYSDEIKELADSEGLDCYIDGNSVTVETFHSETDANDFLGDLNMIIGF
jgi:hypothetical protein